MGGRRLLSDGKGRVLSEEERAKESVYIQVQTLNPSR
jgi:ATPase inhibitor, mitochondrial